MSTAAGIQSFLGAIKKGMAMSNTFEVEFKGLSDKLKRNLAPVGFGSFGPGTASQSLILLCEEASLPGIMASTGQTTGVLMGEGQVNYAHTKSYQDITLGWTCDANLLPLKFLNAWSDVIFDDVTKANDGRFSRNRLSYPVDYMCKELVITKAERNAANTLGRVGGIYTLYDAWPYSIQSTPVSYGASTLLKVTASFYYRRWIFKGKNV
jgi:hypothetical protein